MNSIEAVAEVIQLAVAPVFLLAGIAGMLGAFSTRLARIIDRARVIERRIPQVKLEEKRALLRRETGVLCVYGSGFGSDPADGFFRVVFLANPAELSAIYELIANFTQEFLARRGR